MALFTNKADRHISILTRLYQVEPHEYEALIPQLWEAHSLYRPIHGVQEEEEARLIADLVNDDADRLTFFLDLLRETMNCIADGVELDVFQSERLNDTIKKHVEPPLILWVHGVKNPGKEHPGYELPDGRARYYPEISYGDEGLSITHKPLLDQIRARACATLLYAVERAEFKRCEECEHPFPTLRKRQYYCSRRCGARAGERRRYEERFREYKKVRTFTMTTGRDTVEKPVE